jgi:bacterioferritin-associated ferredoxin
MSMYVCLCKGITDQHIRDAVDDGAVSMRSLNRELGVASQCSKCTRHAREILRDTLAGQAEHRASTETLVDQPTVQQWMPQPA